MKKRLALLALGLCCGASLLGGFSGAIAWFHDQAIVSEQDSLIGASQGAYFACGEGTSNDPYIINRPIHLYNLAWLQYIGYFNDDNAPYYFALDPVDDKTTLDMEGWVLPPIGTGLYPFIGNFNGNGETIANLTTDNVIGTDHIVKTPTLITSASYDENGVLKTYKKASESTPASFLNSTVDIVGFFGAVGEIDSMAPVTPSYAEANAISSVALDGLKVSSGSSSTLIGLACGYDNAALNGVAINGSELYAKNGATATSYTENLSDYSLVGYATASAIKKCIIREDAASLPKINNPNTKSGGQNWGGSIDMKHMYEQLASIRDGHQGIGDLPATIPCKYISAKSTVNGVEDVSQRVYSIDNRNDVDTYRYEWNKFYDEENGNRDYASFTFAREMNSSFTAYEDGEGAETKYNCLYGSKTVTATNRRTHYTKSAETRTGFKIYSADGNYMQNSGGTIGSTTDETTATIWFWDGSRIMSQPATSSTTYYLRYNGSLALKTTTGSEWVYDNENETFRTTYNNNYYYLFCGATWTAARNKTVSYYTISYQSGGVTHYLAATSDANPTLYDSTTLTAECRWTISTYATVVRGGNTYYLKYSSGNIALQTGNNGYRFSLKNNRLVFYDWYYVSFNNGNWVISTGTANAATVSNRSETAASVVSKEASGYYYTSVSSRQETATYETEDTYFPLLMEPNTFKPMNGYIDPDDEQLQPKYNTGYVVSGANDTTSSPYQQAWGDIRVSGFNYSNNTTNFGTIRTRTMYLSGSDSIDSGWTTVNDNTSANLRFRKFIASHSQLNEVLSDSRTDGYIYGLHFMSANISASRYATIGRAVVLDGKSGTHQDEQGHEVDNISIYNDYKVPQDSIDFHLKSYGYINFYAGTYFSSNDAFFSLHQVFRNGNEDLVDTRHIVEIYSPDYQDNDGYLPADEDHPYIYKYKNDDDTFSWSHYAKDPNTGKWICTVSSETPAHGPQLFDSAWIEQPSSTGHTLTSKGLYYFEIPVNSGEYALGSVSGGTGAYLLYLDIGAGIANPKDVDQYETIVTSITELLFPIGVDFVDLTNLGETTLETAAPGGNSPSVAIKETSTTVAVHYAYSGNTSPNSSALALTKAGNDPPMPKSAFVLQYQDELAEVTYAGSSLTLSADVSYTITLERMISEHYNPNTGSGTVSYTFTEDYAITNGKKDRRIQLPNAGVDYSPTWTVVDGSESVASVSGTGLVSFLSSGSASIHATWSYSNEIGPASNWTPLRSNNNAELETDKIVSFHFIDYTLNTATPPNVVVTYTYTGSQTDNTQSFVYNINVENKSGRSIVLVIDALKLSFETELHSTYAVTITYDGIPHNVTAVNQRFVIPAAS